MVKLNVVRASNASLVQKQPLVAVFFGAASRIGHYTLRTLSSTEAKNNGKGFRAYLIGRKADSAEKIISECRGICPAGEFKLIKADDISLMKDVDRVCAETIKLEQVSNEPSGTEIYYSGKVVATFGTEGLADSGVYALDWNGENTFKTESYAKFNKNEMKKDWNHVKRCFEVIESGNVFKE